MANRGVSLNVSALAIRNPIPVILLALIALAAGIVSFRQLPITLLPSIEPPIVSVVVTDFGATPTELEDQVTRKVEAAVSGIAGVHHVTSSISDGISATAISFNLSVDTDKATRAVKAAVAQITPDLPRGIDAPIVKRINAVGLNIVTYAAESSNLTPEKLSALIDDDVIGGLKALPGVGSVERIGGVTREISVKLDPVALAMHGLTAAEADAQLKAAQKDAGAPQTLSELAATPIHLPRGGSLRLDALAHVTDTTETPRTFARLNGQPIVAFGVLRAKGASDVTVADEVEKFVHKAGAAHPEVAFRLIDTSVRYTQGNYDAALHTLFEGAGLAILVVFLFLRDFRATIIAAIALPLSIVPAFFVMKTLGFSLNLISLLAITLATGILVDDAIVEIENIVRHMNMGKTAMQAAIDAADEIGLAVIAISLTIVAVFAPVSFIGSVAGQYFEQFGLTISAEVIFSLLAARFVTPTLAAYFLKPRTEKREEKTPAWAQHYGKVVTWSVEHRFTTLVIGLVFFGLSILSITSNLVSRDFQPVQDSGRSHLAIALAPSAALKDTQAMADTISARLRKRPEVTSVFIDGGRISPGTPEVRKAQLIVNYVPKTERKLSVAQLEGSITADLAAIPGLRAWFVDDYGARPVARIFTGPDGSTLAKFAAELAREMKGIKLVSNILISSEADRKEFHIAPKDADADKLGVSQDALTRTITLATIGDSLSHVTAPDGRSLPVRVTLGGGSGATGTEALAQLQLPGKNNAVPFGAVASLESLKGPATLTRFDGARSVSVEADLANGAALGDVEKAIDALPLMKHMPPGVESRKSAMAESMEELSSGFAEAMRNGLILVYIVLVLLFARVLQPITILFSLPLSIGGAIIALLITGRPLSLPVIIGILMLMGIVTKNAIMLVDFANRAIARGVPRTAAIAEAGTKRARPIVMTTIAMVAGMVPSALGLGAGGEFRSPMAIAVIGGLIASTFLSLLFVPAVFAVTDDMRRAGLAGLRAVIALPRKLPKLQELRFVFTRKPSSANEPAE
ncbi:ABC transporter permease [Methylovirgula ligni]|nr:efflux RND transporter permease subunit [Methylovirgula ligni]QAY97354.1 ABC transporter permease [Methylovirgula ligni]